MLVISSNLPKITTNEAFTHDMNLKGFKASLRRARRLEDREYAQGLPPGEKVEVYPVDALPGCPQDWVRGQGSYVCPVHPEWGLWFDFTDNDAFNTAVMMSVKGMNPITGQKLDGLGLEQYKECCPVHKDKFLDGLFCEKCGYKWPNQSYVSYPNTLWWDGFRQPDGSVRQFFFSEDENRDVASHVIGKHNTVPAFGFAFYKTKVARVVQTMPSRSFMSYNHHTSGGHSLGGWGLVGGGSGTKLGGSHYASKVVPQAMFQYVPDEQVMFCCNSVSSSSEEKTSGIVLSDCPVSPDGPPATRSILRSVSVGAGAKIHQELMPDSLGLDGWESEPVLMRLYFVFEEQFKHICKAGVKNLNGSSEGFLKGVPVG